MSYVSRKVYTRQCCCTVGTTLRCNCTAAGCSYSISVRDRRIGNEVFHWLRHPGFSLSSSTVGARRQQRYIASGWQWPVSNLQLQYAAEVVISRRRREILFCVLFRRCKWDELSRSDDAESSTSRRFVLLNQPSEAVHTGSLHTKKRLELLLKRPNR